MGGDTFKDQNQRGSAAAWGRPSSHQLSAGGCAEGRESRILPLYLWEPELERKMP